MNDTENQWENLFAQLPLDSAARDEYQKQLKTQVLNAFDRSQQQPHARLKRTRQLFMKSKLVQFTAAAAVIAAIITVFQFGDNRAYALETLVARIVDAKSARWESVLDIGEFGQRKVKTTVIPGHTRQENEDGSITIFDWKAGKALSLSPKTKVALQMNIGEDTKDFDGGNTFEMLRGTLASHLDSGKLKNAKPAEKKTVAGRELVGFRIDKDLMIWAADGRTLPLEIEFTISQDMKVHMQNYESNFPVEQSLFSLDIPEGYTTTQINLPTNAPNETEFINTLRLYCESSNGTFPPGLDIASTAKATAKIQMHLLKNMKLGEDGATGAQIEELTNKVMGFTFVTTLSVRSDADAHYAGANVKLGTDDRPIFWYKPVGSEKFRVILADLTVKEQEIAPTVESAVQLSR